jgi:small ligand-binding sensory domain FIST
MGAPRFASALSTLPTHDAAFREVVERVSAGLAGARPDLVAAFVSHHHGSAIEDLGPRLAQALHARHVLGCTGESIVGAAREVEDAPALSLWAAVLPDPYSFPVAEFLELLNDKLPGVPAVGGMASGGTGPGQNLLFTEDGVVEGGAVGAVLEGAVEIRPVVSQGCRPVGKPLVITSCRDNAILKLGGKPALEVLVELLQSLPARDQRLLQRGPFLGLAVDARKSTFERGDFLVRGIMGLEQQHGAVVVADNSIRNGMTVQFLVRDADSAGEDLAQLLRARAGGPGAASEVGALLFSCNGRGTRMFTKPDHDIACLQESFGAPVPAAGFFAAGEIGPVGGRNHLHGFTASVAVFRARG